MYLRIEDGLVLALLVYICTLSSFSKGLIAKCFALLPMLGC